MKNEYKIALADRQIRNSSIELLRIISMFMIVFHHFAVHGGFEWNVNELTIPHFWYNFIMMGGKIGVDIFVLISGYFLINSKEKLFDFKRILKYWGQVFFYSILLYVFLKSFVSSGLEMKFLIKACFPITFGGWWFASTYFVMYLMHPFLNKLFNSLDKKAYQTLLVMTIACWSIIPTFTTKSYEGNSLLWFITLYAIAGYIRKFGLNKKYTTKYYFLFWLIFSILTYLSSVVFTIMGTKWEIFAAHSTYFYGQEKLSILLTSLSLFMVFTSLKMRYYKWINIIASATFGVYLIHDNKVVRSFLWFNIFKNAQFQHSNFIIPYSIMVVVLVYVVCTVIDLLRQKVVERPFMWIVNKYSQLWLVPLKKVCDFCKAVAFVKD